MILFSAAEDFQETTLKAIAGALRKLEYVSGLRDEQGRCTHWGLARVYGEAASQRALAEAHDRVLSRILSTPLRNLERDLQESSEHAGVSEEEYLRRLSGNRIQLLPPAPGAGSERHLNSLLHALSCLLKARRLVANSPALSQHRPLVQ